MRFTTFTNSSRSSLLNQNHVAMMPTQHEPKLEVGSFQKSLFHQIERVSQMLDTTPSVLMMTAFHILAFHWQKENKGATDSFVLEDMKVRKLLRKIQVTVEGTQNEETMGAFYLHLLDLDFSFPLSAIVDTQKSAQKIWIEWKYREDLIDQKTVVNFIECFPQLLEFTLANLEMEISLFKTFFPACTKKMKRERQKYTHEILPKIEVLDYDWGKAKKEDTFIFPAIEEAQGLIESLRKKKEKK